MNRYLNRSYGTPNPHVAIAFIAVMFSMALSPNAALAGVYKCKDAKGKITYSDSPCQNSAAQLPVHGSAQYENSAAGRQAAAANRSEAERRKTQEVSSVARRSAQERAGECDRAASQLADMASGGSNAVAFARQKMAADALCGTSGVGNRGHNNVECDRAASKLANMAGGGSNAVAFAQQKMVVDAVCGTNRSDTAGVTSNTGPNQGVGSTNQDFDVQMKAKRDYQKQQIPGFITHQPTDAHERGVYKQEMNRQKNMDPNTWNR